jgi:CDP-paratose 2-epimerase
VRVLITGICGFAGSQLARHFRARRDAAALEITGIDNLSRGGSDSNRGPLTQLGIRVVHGDVRMASDLEMLGAVDWVIDAAAKPSVLAGVDGTTSSRQLVEHNLLGTVNLLEHCKRWGAGFILLSTSRVYSIAPLSALPVEARDYGFRPILEQGAPAGISSEGVTEAFSTAPPVSLYGATKVASELLALEYHHSLGVPVWIDRCGVLGGAGQFGHAEQGIFSYWINAHLRRQPLRYIGFGGTGLQVRDCLHPADLGELLLQQMEDANNGRRTRVVNVAGGARNSISLAQLTRWCDDRFGRHTVAQEGATRPFDVPWLVLDSALASESWDWQPRIALESILSEIAEHAERNPRWLEISRGM